MSNDNFPKTYIDNKKYTDEQKKYYFRWEKYISQQLEKYEILYHQDHPEENFSAVIDGLYYSFTTIFLSLFEQNEKEILDKKLMSIFLDVVVQNASEIYSYASNIQDVYDHWED